MCFHVQFSFYLIWQTWLLSKLIGNKACLLLQRLLCCAFISLQWLFKVCLTLSCWTWLQKIWSYAKCVKNRRWFFIGIHVVDVLQNTNICLHLTFPQDKCRCCHCIDIHRVIKLHFLWKCPHKWKEVQPVILWLYRLSHHCRRLKWQAVWSVMSEHMGVHASLIMMRSAILNFVNRHDQIVCNLTDSFIMQWQVTTWHDSSLFCCAALISKLKEKT